MWGTYGILYPDTAIIIVNMVGLTVQLTYICIYIHFTQNKVGTILFINYDFLFNPVAGPVCSEIKKASLKPIIRAICPYQLLKGILKTIFHNAS